MIYFLILSTIYIFIPVSGYLWVGTSTLLCPGTYYAVKMDLKQAQVNL